MDAVNSSSPTVTGSQQAANMISAAVKLAAQNHQQAQKQNVNIIDPNKMIIDVNNFKFLPLKFRFISFLFVKFKLF